MIIPSTCRYCNGNVILCDSSTIYYGKSYGNIYLCTHCRAYIGAHKETNKPLGTLADKFLREKRKITREIIESWCRTEEIKRDVAYKWLAEILGHTTQQNHTGFYDANDCDTVIQFIRENSLGVAS